MEIPAKELSAENISFSKEKSILNDIAQETKDAPGYGGMSEDELMEKVESILLDKIKAGEKQAYFQLGLFYYEQVGYEPHHEKTYFFAYAKNKCAHKLRGNRTADQCLCFCFIDSTIPLLSKAEISRVSPFSVDVQPGLCCTWLETRNTGFLVTRLI